MNEEIQRLLDSIYLNPSSEGSFGGLERLYKSAHELNAKVNRDVVKNYLKTIDTYTLHRDARRNFPRQPTIAPYPDAQWQADLVFVINLSEFNDNYKYILTCIDIFSKFAWAVPLKSKNASELVEAFQHIFTQSGRLPEKLQTDKGTEFLNSTFQNFLKTKNVHFFTTNSDTKAAVCERFNRTLKNRMWRYFKANNTRRYIEVLPKLLTSYNNSKHRTIGIEPVNVNADNQAAIWKKFQKEKVKAVGKKIPKFFVDETVRISSNKLQFEKGYTGNWTEEVFYVNKIYKQHLPFMYRLRDSNGEVIEGRFYEQELQSVTVSADKEFVIERIVKKRKLKGHKPEVLVKWRGYPDSANTWQPAENIKDL